MPQSATRRPRRPGRIRVAFFLSVAVIALLAKAGGLVQGKTAVALTPAQQRLAQTMQWYWTNLAKTGRPAAQWPLFSPASAQRLSLVPPHPQVETDFAAEHHCGFWAAAG